MSKKRSNSRPKLPRGRPQTHGGWSFLTLKGILPEHRREVTAYISGIRNDLVRDLGPLEADLTAGQRILIDRTTTALGVVRCIEEYIKENSVMKGSDLAPALKASYLAYCGHVRLNIQALGIAAKVTGGSLGGRLRFEYGKAQDQEDDRRRLVIEVIKTRLDKEDVVFNMPRPGQLGEGKSEIEARKCLPEVVRGQAEAGEGSGAGREIVDPGAPGGQIPEQGPGEGTDQAQNRPGIEIQGPPARRIDELEPGDMGVARNQVKRLQLEIENLGRRKQELLAKRRKDDGQGGVRLIGEKKR